MLALMVSTFTSAQQSYQLKKATMTIAGTSTLHDWVSEVTEIQANAVMNLTNPAELLISKLNVQIPVEKIVSTKGRIMDNKTYKALKSDDHPSIKFNLTKLTKQDQNKLWASGELTIAGDTQNVKLEVAIKQSAEMITFSGEYKLKMTDFNIDPPTALMGTIKTGDDITVAFEVSLTTQESAAN